MSWHTSRALPTKRRASFDDIACLAVHATPADPLYRYLAPTDPAWEGELDGAGADLVLVGHTHRQFERTIG